MGLIAYKDIKQVHLEISTRCNAACPDCPRNFRGVDVDLSYPLVDMRLEQAKHIFTPAFLNQLESIFICGNLGDFITARDGLAIVEYFKQTNPQIHIAISTNASGRPEIWQPLGKLGVAVLFRLDGLADTHSLYRQDTDFGSIIKNAKEFIAAGGDAVWQFILFDHNKHQIEQCRSLSKELGFTDFTIVEEGRNTFPVFDRKGNFRHTIGPYNGSTVFSELYPPQEESITMPNVTGIKCFAQDNKEIYIAANGDVYPCCWLGFYPLQGFKHFANSQLIPIIKENNALQYSLEHCIEWFDSIESSWTKPKDRLLGCERNCGVCKK